MENVSIGGRQVAGFALGERVGVGDSVLATPAYAAVMTGATVGLLAYVLRAPTWATVISGVGAALVTNFGIQRSA